MRPIARGFLLAALGAIMAGPAMAEFQPMDDREMSGVTGREGIAFEWDLRINSDANGDSLTSIPREERRLALKFAERDEAGGEWVVLKDFSGRINFPRFTLDAFITPSAPTARADTSRFVSGTGASVSPYNQANLLVTFPEDIEIYNLTVGGIAVEYGDGLTAGSGFRADPTDSRSFMGLAIGNSQAGQPATISAEGQMTIFGF